MDRIAHEGIGASVTMMGERNDIPELLNAADAYVMSSAWEGAPIVLLEASASRLPIATTDVGGNGELVSDGKTGLLVAHRNPEALSQAMMRIMDMTPEERAAMGKAARKRVRDEFAMDAILDQWEALYAEFLNRSATDQ